MDAKVIQFLEKNRVCSLSTQLSDNSPHGAAMHYSIQQNPLLLYFSADRTNKKMAKVLKDNVSKASVVVGFSEEEWVTLQMDGRLTLVACNDEVNKIKKVHYLKNPTSQEFENDPGTIFLIFKPSWWRYTDYNTDPPKILKGKS